MTNDQTGGDVRVLIVEDVVAAADTLATLLALRGYEVTVAYDGGQAMAAAASDRPDAVILDIGLPDINGCDVAAQMRALYGAALLLVAYTGYLEPQVRRDAMSAGFDKFLTKPASLEVLETALRG